MTKNSDSFFFREVADALQNSSDFGRREEKKTWTDEWHEANQLLIKNEWDEIVLDEEEENATKRQKKNRSRIGERKRRKYQFFPFLRNVDCKLEEKEKTGKEEETLHVIEMRSQKKKKDSSCCSFLGRNKGRSKKTKRNKIGKEQESSEINIRPHSICSFPEFCQIK